MANVLGLANAIAGGFAKGLDTIEDNREKRDVRAYTQALRQQQMRALQDKDAIRSAMSGEGEQGLPGLDAPVALADGIQQAPNANVSQRPSAGLGDSNPFQQGDEVLTRLNRGAAVALKQGDVNTFTQLFNKASETRKSLFDKAMESADRAHSVTGDYSVYVPIYNKYLENGVEVEAIEKAADGSFVAKGSRMGKPFEQKFGSEDELKSLLAKIRDPQGFAAAEARTRDEMLKHARAMQLEQMKQQGGIERARIGANASLGRAMIQNEGDMNELEFRADMGGLGAARSPAGGSRSSSGGAGGSPSLAGWAKGAKDISEALSARIPDTGITITPLKGEPVTVDKASFLNAFQRNLDDIYNGNQGRSISPERATQIAERMTRAQFGEAPQKGEVMTPTAQLDPSTFQWSRYVRDAEGADYVVPSNDPAKAIPPMERFKQERVALEALMQNGEAARVIQAAQNPEQKKVLAKYAGDPEALNQIGQQMGVQNLAAKLPALYAHGVLKDIVIPDQSYQQARKQVEKMQAEERAAWKKQQKAQAPRPGLADAVSAGWKSGTDMLAQANRRPF